jgi:hypothetical protein
MTTRQLKLIGEIILASSFVTQTLLFDYYNDKSKSLSDSYNAQALVDKGSELKEIKYFVSSLTLDSLSKKQYQELNIGLAAQKIAIGKAIQIGSLDTNKQAKVDMCNELIQASFKVKTFNDYMKFIAIVNNQYVGDKVLINQIQKIENRKDVFRWLFWALYLIGTMFLICSTIKEKKN